MKVIVGEVPLQLRFDRTQSPVFQNLGESYLWLARTPGSPVEDGLRLEPGGTLAFGGPMMASGGPSVYVQASARDEEEVVEADVRVEPAPDLID